MEKNTGRMNSIYILENKINGKCYIGQTSHSFKQRFARHRSEANRNTITPFYNAIRKYGWDNFKQYIFNGIPDELLDYFETELIRKLNTISPDGYNLDSGGCKLKKHHEDTKKKIGESAKGRVPSEETRLKISIANKGKKRTDETKNKMRDRFIGKQLFLGKKHTNETKKKMSDTRKKLWENGIYSSHEYREKMRLSHLGIKTGKRNLKNNIY